jgi:DNA-binding response OmpR family regulator
MIGTMADRPPKEKSAGAGKPLVFAVDDEPDLLELVAIHLGKSGFQARTFANGQSLLAALKSSRPDLLILDLMLPDLDGLDICRRMKAEPRTAAIPILMLTARADEVDIVLGLELGADDYMVKPFSPKVLIARVKAVLRRRNEEPVMQEVIGGILEIDPDRHTVSVSGRPVELTSTEFAILRILTRNPGWVLSREKILDRLWGDDKSVLDRTVDVHIKNLRDKLGLAGSLIKNVRGVGYKIEP